MGKKNVVLSFVKELPQNVFAGFVVSLIALPLGLGLAIASEAPPLSGIIAAIAGGLVVSIFGGSHVTIAGPGNGLVIVLLGAITILGEGDLYQGYLYTLAAIIFSGVLLFIFGVLRYSIGHYARIVRADLLIMNAQEESTFLNRFFPKDLEHILAELPTDVLIIQSESNG